MSTERLPFRLVVIDDNHSDIVLLQEAIADSGHPIEMIPFTSPVQALAALPSVPAVDLVLCDINMPLMNGFELAERLHAVTHLGMTAVVLMSSAVGLEMPTTAHRRGRDLAYIRKGVTWSDFRAIADALHRRMDAMRAETRSDNGGLGSPPNRLISG